MDQWYREARERGRARRRRARPVVLATLGALVAGLAALVVADAVHGVALPVYAVVGVAVVVAGFLVGLAVRRPAFSLTWLLVPALLWLVAFGGTHVSFRDGIGADVNTPTAAELQSEYRLAFGRLTLDLSDVYGDASPAAMPDRVTVRVAAGVARLVVPDDADVTVEVQVRTGGVVVDSVDEPDGRLGGGWRATTRVAPRGSDGPPLLVVLQVTDGVAVVDHSG